MTHHHRTREEIAKIEIGHTDFSPGVARFLSLAFLAIIFAVPLVQIAGDVRARWAGSGVDAAPWPHVLTAVRLVPGRGEINTLLQCRSTSEAFGALKTVNARILRDINLFEDELKQQSWLRAQMVPHVQMLLTGFLKGGNEDAYCGREGWLFYRADLDLLTGGAFLDARVLKRRAAAGNEWQTPPQPDPIKAIVTFRNQLRARGVDLLLVPVPVKPMIHPERFTARYAANAQPLHNPSYATLLSRLEHEGIKVFDPTPHLILAKASSPQPLYLETDTHWTPQGMRLVAARLADYIRERCTLPETTPHDYTLRPQHVTNLGDIAGMLKLPEGAAVYRPQTVEIQQVLLPDGSLWQPNEEADVLLLGDSFANIFSFAEMNWGASAGLTEHLSAALRRPLDAIIRNAGGSYASREILAEQMRSGRDRLSGKRLVIWEFAARDLASGDWKLINLPDPSAVASTPLRAEDDATAPIQVRARIEEVSRAPDVGAPYADAVTYARFTVVTSDSGNRPTPTFRVAAMAMQARRLLAPTKWRIGDEVTLRLVPYASHVRDHPEIDRLQSLNDLEDYESDLYWLVEDSP